jgi:hypothetical protein
MLDVGKLSKRYPGLIPDFAMWEAETAFDRECVSSNLVTSATQCARNVKARGDRKKARHLWTIRLLQTVSMFPNQTKRRPVRPKSPPTH